MPHGLSIHRFRFPMPSAARLDAVGVAALVAWLVLSVAGCSSNDGAGGGDGDDLPPSSEGGSVADDDDDGAGMDGDDDDEACFRDGSEVVRFETDDGVTLEADLVVAGRRGGPGVVLLHMIPPSNDRTGYPAAFLEALADAGITLLNVDRRGAGGSEGDPREAYEGPNGKRDAVAAVRFLLAHPCALDPDAIGLVGASNGTTTVLDFAVHAAETDGLRVPAAVAFLSGGRYTEAQNEIAAHLELLSGVPMLFAYPASEAPWNDALAARDVAGWRFQRYDPGAHGTRLFGTDGDAVTALLVEHFASHLGD